MKRTGPSGPMRPPLQASLRFAAASSPRSTTTSWVALCPSSRPFSPAACSAAPRPRGAGPPARPRHGAPPRSPVRRRHRPPPHAPFPACRAHRPAHGLRSAATGSPWVSKKPPPSRVAMNGLPSMRKMRRCIDSRATCASVAGRNAQPHASAASISSWVRSTRLLPCATRTGPPVAGPVRPGHPARGWNPDAEPNPASPMSASMRVSGSRRGRPRRPAARLRPGGRR